MRCALVRLTEKRWRLLFSNHHVLMDGWCLPILLREVLSAYEAARRGEKASLPIARPYRSYIGWLQRQDRAAAERFWREELVGFSASIRLGIDSFGGSAAGVNEQQDLEISESFSARLTTFARHHRVTLNTLFQGAWALLLGRYSGEDDIVFGVSSSGRPPELEGVEETIGLFLRTLPARTILSREQNALSVLEQLQERQTARELHGHVGLTEIQTWSEVPRGTPLFESLFIFENYPHGAPNVLDASLEISDIRSYERTHYPLSVAVIPGERIAVQVSYNRGRFEQEAMARLLGHYQRLLEGIAAKPDARLSELPLFDDAERNRVLLDWNETSRDYAKDVLLHELIEAQVERTPDAVAVVFEDQRLTYREVNRRANQLAHRLRKFGVGPEVIVGVFAERSVEMVVGLVATLKAGGAYLPLDPSYPGERLAFMLGDAQPTIVLVQRSLAVKLPQYAGEIIFLEDDFSTESDANPINLTQPENLAYVIYTSGSTGRPKGVMNTHRGICNRLLWMQETYQLSVDERVLQKTPFTFDVSVWEFFWPLLTGAQLVVAQPGLHGDSQYLIRVICENAITTLHFVPSMLAAFLEDKDAAHCLSLGRVICSGEALPFELQERFFSTLPATQLHNLYGPTEAAVDVTFWQCERGPGESMVPIGHPVANTQVYILDRAMQPVPPGVGGELHIGGVQLARGYLARPELTAEKFVSNPFGGGRLYKTGDLARYRSEGTIEFLGRIDHQVKLRGFRIELGEIESVLRKHPAVRDCVVLAREDQRADSKRLVAYALLDEELTTQALRRHAAAFLPDYMVPSALVVLEKLPLNGSGKIDRGALPEPAAIPTEKVLVRPRDALETQLAAIWEKVLENAPIGVADDFFELGGNSLRAVRVMAEIKKAFGRNLPLSILFKTPTVETLAQALRNGSGPIGWSPLVPIQLRGERPPFFAIHGVHGNVLFYRPLAQLLGKEQPFCGIQSQGLDGEPITRTSIEAMADYYIEQIQRVQPHGPYLLGGYSLGGSIAYEMARRLRLAGEAVPLVVLIDAGNPARPPRLVSYRERLRKALRDPASLFMVDRLARILAGRIRGKAGAQFLDWNDQYQKTKWRLAKKLGRNEAYDLTELHIQMVHTRAVLAFRPLPFKGKITLIRTLELEPGYEYDPYLGWDSLAEDGIEVHEVPGAHLELFSDENVSVLAKILDGCIQSALATPNDACVHGSRKI
jgi:surfactin family lipopeptide synthetase C